MSQVTFENPLAASTAAMHRPPYDPLLEAAVKSSSADLPEILDLNSIRKMADDFSADSVLKARPDLSHTEHAVPGPAGNNSSVILSVFKSNTSTKTDRPALYVIHGGGQIAGNRFSALSSIISYFGDIDAVFVSVEYRVAPEHRAPAALLDSYAGLVWMAQHATDFGVNPARIIVSGGSGGGPIAVGTTMLCRNQKRPYPLAQMILTPMLDDRDNTISSKQYARDGPWCGTTNRMAWEHVLGDERGGANVSELIAPARATDLTGLAPTFIDAGECEVFRDETVAFASQLWKSGVSTELHIWPGAFHGFDMLGATSPVAIASRAAKMGWIRRILGETIGKEQ